MKGEERLAANHFQLLQGIYRTKHIIDRTAQYLEDAHAAIFDDALPAKVEEQLFRAENLRTWSSRLSKQLPEEAINDQLWVVEFIWRDPGPNS